MTYLESQLICKRPPPPNLTEIDQIIEFKVHVLYLLPGLHFSHLSPPQNEQKNKQKKIILKSITLRVHVHVLQSHMPFITKQKVYILDMYRGFIGNDKEEEKMSKTYHIKK